MSEGVAVRVEGLVGVWKARGDHLFQYFWVKCPREKNKSNIIFSLSEYS